MHLTEVHLRNWRSYRNVTFAFPIPQGDHNVVLVGAQNGTGKTSLLISLYLGLFGRESVHMVEGVRVSGGDEERVRSYRILLERLLHRPSLKDEAPYMSVRLRFQDGARTVLVTRRWNFRSQGKIRDLASRDGEEVLIEADGRPRIYPTWQEANDQIKELLFPHNVLPCFFFDGEQAQERVEEAGGRALLDAVNTLYGTGILDELNRSLKTYIANETASLRRDVGSVRLGELDEKRLQLDGMRDHLQEANRQLTEHRRIREGIESERHTHTTELYQLVGDSTADIEEYAGTIRALESELADSRSRLTKGLASLALPLALSRSAARVSSIIRAEQIRDRWLLLKEEATKKAQQIIDEVLPAGGLEGLEPPLTTGQAEHLRDRLNAALRALWSPPPDGCADAYFFEFLQDRDRAAVLGKVEKLSLGIPDIEDTVLAWNSTITQLRNAQQRFEIVRDIQPRLSELKDKINSLGEQIRGLDAEILGFERKEDGLRTQINEIKAVIGQMEKKQRIADPVQEKLDVAHRIRTVVTDAKEALVSLCKDSLEERCTHHFRNMITDEYTSFSVCFDPDSEPRLEGPGGEIVYVTSLSGAQKRAFGLAFTLAVADVSGQAAPIVIDTPVGNMDSRYRSRVLQYVSRCAPGQVIFLSHDEEISPEYKKKLTGRILQTYLVSFEKIEEGSGISTVSPDRYFGD